MALSEADERRVEGEVHRMTLELRDRPSQDKEDKIGVEIARLPAEERAFVTTTLMRMLVADREGRTLEVEPLPPRAPARRRRGWFRF